MSEGWNILVVDDELPIRAELRYLLEKDTRVGQIAEAGNVTEAVELILSSKPDVLFLDITMPACQRRSTRSRLPWALAVSSMLRASLCA